MLGIVQGVTDEPDDVPEAEGEPEAEDEPSDVEGTVEEQLFDAAEAFSAFSKVDFSILFPKIEPPDFSALIPKVEIPDLSAHIPKVDLPDFSAFVPKLDLPDFSALMPQIDLSDLVPNIQPMLEELARAVAPLIALIRENLPHNWPPDIDLDVVTTVIRDDGLPLVYVPRTEIVAELLAAQDRSSRVGILISHTNEVIEDCRAALDEVTHPSISSQLPLAVKALDAFEGGHYEAAQALAVVITETAVTQFFSGKKYDAIKKEVNFDPKHVYITKVRVQAALAPIGAFFTTWYPSSGLPAPEALSRHVSVHQADDKHYSRGNATVAVLLVSSVLRALQELREL